MGPEEIVRSGYDALGTQYREAFRDYQCYDDWLDELAPLLPGTGRVLDFWCGNGIPVAKRLSATHQIVGVDLSPVQIRLAQQNVPGGAFLCGDMAVVDFEPESFSAVVAFYSIIHLPLDEQTSVFRKIHQWLQPRGPFMATLGSQPWTGTEQDWLQPGVTMYWSHTNEETYAECLNEPSFELDWSRFIPEGTGGHSLMLAHKR